MHARLLAESALATAREYTRKLINGFPESQMTRQLTPGDVHAMWILGHLAVSDEWVRSMIGGGDTALPVAYKSQFGHGSSAVADLAAYPPPEEVRIAFEQSRRRLLDEFREANDETLARPLGEAGVGFATTPLDAINKTAWHEGWHAGQLSRIRRALHLPPIFPT